MLAHNSVDRGIMARDSIELNLDETNPSPGKPSRVRSNQQSAFSIQPEQSPPRTAGGRRSQPRAAVLHNEDDSELLINRDDFDLDELDNEEAQFLRGDRRVPVRRSPIPKKTASQLKMAGLIAIAVITCGGLAAWGHSYCLSSWRFRIESSDAVEISGVRNASRTHVMEVAGADIGKNIFYVPLDERKKQLEQMPWVEQAWVMRLLPNRIAVTIRERTPVAFAQIGPRTSLIDANGVVMGMPANRQTKYSFPVIRGITETEALSSRAAAMKIYNRLVSELGPEGAQGQSGANGGANTNYVGRLSEVDLSDPEDVKVTANDPGGTMVVHLGKEDFLARFKLYVTHIAEWRQQFQNVRSVDLKYEGQVVVNPDRPAAQEKTLPRMNTDNTDLKKAIVKPVSAKAAVKPVSHKVATPAKKMVHRGDAEARRKQK